MSETAVARSQIEVGRGSGIRQYLYEYVYHQAIAVARTQTGQIIPISQARAIRRDIDQRLAEQDLHVVGARGTEPNLPQFLGAVNNAMVASIPGLSPVFTSLDRTDRQYQRMQAQFMYEVGIGSSAAQVTRLPISPYDPQWADRASVRSGGTSLSYLSGAEVREFADGSPARVASSEMGGMTLWRVSPDGKRILEAGPAVTHEDLSGLSVLSGYMSEREYAQVRGWLLDGAWDRGTGQRDPALYMSSAALARATAVLDELQAQGIPYTIQRDLRPGQIKAVLGDTGMEVRLADQATNEDYVGRVYDHGTVLRWTSNVRIGDRTIAYAASPEEAVDLLRFAQGQAVERRDHPGLQVGVPGTTHSRWIPGARGSTKGRLADAPDNYIMSGGNQSTFAYRDYAPRRERGEHVVGDGKVFITRDARSHRLPVLFVKEDAAEQFLQRAVTSAREHYMERLGVEGLIAHAAQQRELLGVDALTPIPDADPPEFSADADIASTQRVYWDVLSGRRERLMRPGATQEMLDARLGEIGALTAEEFAEIEAGGFNNLTYTGDAREQVRAHARDAVEDVVGTYEPIMRMRDGEFTPGRFDPQRVARYMTSEKSQYSNLDDLASACRRLGIPAQEMLGDDFQAERFKDRLITFDETTAVPIAEHPEPFLRTMGETVRGAIARSACEPGEILIDAQGVVRYTAQRQKANGESVETVGEIGQIFAPGQHGEIITRFASGENALIVPGYEARIAIQRPGEQLSVEERTILRGYEQIMRERIEYQIAGDLSSARTMVGEPASLTSVYSRLYGTKHPVDHLEQSMIPLAEVEVNAEGLFDERDLAEHRRMLSDLADVGEPAPEAVLNPRVRAVLQTEARRVHYGNEIKQGSTIFAEYQARRMKRDPANDNHFDAWQLTGGRNMAVLTGEDTSGRKASGGFFDPIMTGGATNQGIVRYLTADAQVGADGRITPGDPGTLTGSRAPIMTRQEMQTLQYDPFDRQQMTGSTIMQASEVTAPTGTALMTFGGWTADDPIVVSTEFAERQRIRGIDGARRPLVVGDKLSDLHGNKGVISLIVDREMDPVEAKAQDLEREVAWFKANPDMDVVMSPFSLISRRNAGSARELMGSERTELVSPDGEQPVKGTVGRMRFAVTHMAVDEKTKIYDDDQIRAGRGRRASSQLAWALGAQGCTAVMREFYGGNTGAEANLREYLLAVGLDMEADGTLRVVGRESEGKSLSHEGIDARPERRLFKMQELPRTVTGSLNTRQLRRDFGDMISDHGGDLELPFPLKYPTGEITERVHGSSWRLPVLSSHLRSGQEFADGSSVVHDYTSRYLDIYEAAAKFRDAEGKLETASPAQQDRLEQQMEQLQLEAQRRYEAITTDLEQRVFSGKNNYIKTGMMSSRLPDSATAVWTSDPRLDVDQVAMGPTMAEQLGLTENDHALIWRDPILRDAGVRYMRVVIDDRLTGVAINPVMGKCFDGDFDGDSVAVVALHSEAAKREAMEKLSVPANLVDKGGMTKDGSYPLGMHVSLDTRVALSKDAKLAEEFESLEREVNVVEREQRAARDLPDAQRAEMDAEFRDRRRDLVGQLSEAYCAAQRTEFGAALVFEDHQSHLDSVHEVCVETGAKGSEGKFAEYARYLGGEDGISGMTQADQEASMFATAMKSHDTGLGGMYSQRAVRALRSVGSEGLASTLEVTYPVTQSILQSKHSAAEARHKDGALRGAARDLWRGRLMERNGKGGWRTIMDAGTPVQASAEQWAAQFADFYSARDGFNVTVRPEHIDRVARALADPQTGMIRDLEEDPDLQGSLMDRMAYGGTLSDLITAADNHENLYDGVLMEAFAPVVTRRMRDLTRNQLEQTQIAEPLAEHAIAPAVIKPDVMAEDERGAQGRRERRPSPIAATAHVTRRPVYLPLIEIEAGTSASHEMEV